LSQNSENQGFVREIKNQENQEKNQEILQNFLENKNSWFEKKFITY